MNSSVATRVVTAGRGRWALASAVVLAAAIAITVAVVRDRPVADPPSVIVIGRLPEPDEAPRLAREPTRLPERLGISAQPVALSAKRLSRAARALLAVDTSVWILGEDGVLRLFDTVPLAPVADENGNAHSPVSSTTLSPDGRRAAFPQRDKVLIVDLVEQSFSEMPVPGPNEWAGWLGDRVVVTQAGSTSLANHANGRVTKAPFSGLNTALADQHTEDVYEIADGDTLNRWTGSQSQPVELQGVTLDRWRNPMWRSGDRLAVVDGGFDMSNRLSVLAIDGARARVSHRLVLGPATPAPSDVTVLGWLTEHKLLIHSAGWILAWDLQSDAMTRASTVDSPPAGLVISLPTLNT